MVMGADLIQPALTSSEEALGLVAQLDVCPTGKKEDMFHTLEQFIC